MTTNHPSHTLQGHGPSCKMNKHFILESPPRLHLHPSLQMAAGNSVVFSRAVSGFLAWLQIPESWGKMLPRHSLPGPGRQDGVCSGEPPPPRSMEGGCWGSLRSQGGGQTAWLFSSHGFCHVAFCKPLILSSLSLLCTNRKERPTTRLSRNSGTT